MKKPVARPQKRAGVLEQSTSLPPGVLLLRPKTMFQWARNPYEAIAADSLKRIGMDIPRELVLPRDREFAFRCHLVPLYSRAVIEFFARKGGPKYWLYKHATYYLAWERMGLEFALRMKLKTTRQNLRALILTSPLGPEYWQKRFDQWRHAAAQSFNHFMAKRFPDVKKLKGSEREAARLGGLKTLSEELPDAIFSEVIARFENNAMLWKTFTQNANRTRKGRWGDPELDTWLIEIWPLVTEYGWNYHQVFRVAEHKWTTSSEDNDTLKAVAPLENRCKKMLGLRLSPAGQAKGGRPREIIRKGRATLPALSALAIGLKSLGIEEEQWILGQVFSEE